MSNSVVVIFMTVITAMLSIIGTLGLMIFNDIRKQVRDNTKHIEGLLSAFWQMAVRVAGTEDHLAARDGYKPPRVIGDAESHPR